MVGKGYLKPDISLARNDTPKALQRLLLDCIKFDVDERPFFHHVCLLYSTIYHYIVLMLYFVFYQSLFFSAHDGTSEFVIKNLVFDTVPKLLQYKQTAVTDYCKLLLLLLLLLPLV